MDITNLDNQEIIKHRKKKASSTSSARKKANHKHNYEKIMIKSKSEMHTGEFSYYLGERCTLCKRINITDYMVTEKEGNHYRMLRNSEVFDRYKHLPLVEVDSIWNLNTENYNPKIH